jgi:hypothetical protein
MFGVGGLFGMLLTAAVAAMSVFFLLQQTTATPLGAVLLTATPIPVPATPTPAAPPTPDNSGQPDSTATPIAGRRDVRVQLAETYLSTQVDAGIRASNVGGGIDESSLDVQPNNIVVIRARPKGSRDFALTFTGQLMLQNDRVVVVPISSSALLTPFRGTIAKILEDNINARIDSYRTSVNFRIQALSTSNEDVIVDLFIVRS